jgi:putative hydrolase of the HAD superfamily
LGDKGLNGIFAKKPMPLKVIAFDADDTLWVNEPYFREVEEKFCGMLEDYLPHHSVSKELLQVEISNLPLYGYGIKGFILSMIETALKVSDKTLDVSSIEKILELGKSLFRQHPEPIEEVENVLSKLKGHYRLVVATKGDLLDQERKLKASGLMHYFHHIEIMSEKKEADYQKLITHLDIQPAEFLMVGNSLKSDVLPVLAIGGHAYHVPYHTTWAHEQIENSIQHDNFKELKKIAELLNHINQEEQAL